MEYKEECLAGRIAENYPEDYGPEIIARIGNLSKLNEGLSEVSKSKLEMTCNQLGLDDIQTKFAFLCARTKHTRFIHPQIYAWFANIVNPKEKDPFKIIDESDLKVILEENFNIPDVNIFNQIELALDASKDVEILHALYTCAKERIPYAGVIRRPAKNMTEIITPGRYII